MKQKYNEVQHGLINLVENENLAIYFESIINLLLTVENFEEFEQSIVVFINIESKYKLYEKKEYYNIYPLIIKTMQDKVTNLIAQNNKNRKTLTNKILTNIFFLNKIIKQIEFEASDELINISKELYQLYITLESNDLNKLILNDIIAICEMLNGDNKCFINYLYRSFTLNSHTLATYGYEKILPKICANNHISLDNIIELVKELCSEYIYFNLTPTERRSIFNTILHILWSLPYVFNNNKWHELYSYWKKLIFKHLQRDELNEAMYLQFFNYHIISNLFQTQEEFSKYNDEINVPMIPYYQEYAIKHSFIEAKKTITSNGKINIALVKDRIDNTSITNTELSLFEILLKDKDFTDNYTITIYSCNYFEKSSDNPSIIKKFEQLGISIINPNKNIIKTEGFFHDHLKDAIKLRENIIKNDTDIMIIGTNNYPAVDFLFSVRTAPKQIFWSHGNTTYNVKNIDLYMLHGAKKNEGPRNFNGHLYHSFHIPLSMNILSPKVSQHSIDIEKEKYPKGKIILGVIGRLVKIDSMEYLKVIVEVMKENPQTIFLACGEGDRNSIIQKIQSIDKEVLDRFFFTGHIDPHIYGHIIDIWPDTFPLPQGQSRHEAGIKGCALVIYSDIKIYSDRLPEEYTKGVKKHYIKYHEGRLSSPQLYKDFLNETINNKNLRNFLSNYEIKFSQVYFEGDLSYFKTLLKDK